MKPELNALYVYGSASFPKFSSRRQPEGHTYVFSERHSIHKVPADKILRYCQTFKIGSVKKTIMFITMDDDEKKAEKFLHAAFVRIKADPKQREIFLSAGRAPKQIGISYE